MSDRPASIFAQYTKHHGTPMPLGQRLLARDSILRSFRIAEGLGVLGEPRKGSPADAKMIDRKREALLEEFRRRWASDDTMGHDAASWYYALFLLHAARERYAGLAEKETAEFFRELSKFGDQPEQLIELTEDKQVSENGPDGLFIAPVGAQALGLDPSKYIGLEVKTVIDGPGLGSTISKLKATMKVGSKVDSDTYRRKSAESARSKLAWLMEKYAAEGRYADAEAASQWLQAIQANDFRQFATVLVVRKLDTVPLQRLPDPDFVSKAFDSVLVFNLWGEIEPAVTRVGPNPATLEWVSEAARRFNFERLRALYDEWGMDINELYGEAA